MDIKLQLYKKEHEIKKNIGILNISQMTAQARFEDSQGHGQFQFARERVPEVAGSNKKKISVKFSVSKRYMQLSVRYSQLS